MKLCACGCGAPARASKGQRPCLYASQACSVRACRARYRAANPPAPREPRAPKAGRGRNLDRRRPFAAHLPSPVEPPARPVARSAVAARQLLEESRLAATRKDLVAVALAMVRVGCAALAKMGEMEPSV